jgi:hypothetical protein
MYGNTDKPLMRCVAGLEWHLLCREITKQLNAKLELYK